MEAIKKSMLHMKKEKEGAEDKADFCEYKFGIADDRRKDAQLKHDELTTQLQKLEYDYKEESTLYKETSKKVDKTERDLIKLQMHWQRQTAKFNEIDEVFEASENKLESTMMKLENVQRVGDEAARLVRVLTSRSEEDSKRLKKLEKDLQQVTAHGEESEKKIDEVCHKMQMVEEEIEFAEERVSNNAVKIVQLEEEVAVVGNNLKSLEVSQEMSRLAEIEFQQTITNLTDQLKKTEGRAKFAETKVAKLMREVDKLEDDLRTEHDKITALAIEMEATITELK